MIGPVVIYTAINGNAVFVCEDRRTVFLRTPPRAEGESAYHRASNLRSYAASVEELRETFKEGDPVVVSLLTHDGSGSYMIVARDVFIGCDSIEGYSPTTIEKLAAFFRDRANMIAQIADQVRQNQGIRRNDGSRA